VTCAAVLKNIGVGMDPHSEVSHCFCGWNFDLTIFRRVLFDVAVIVFNGAPETLWEQSCRVNNSGDLRSQIMLLLSKEEWV